MSRVMLTLVAFVALLLGPASLAAAAEGSAGAVYTLTNTAANAVIAYDRSASGALTSRITPSMNRTSPSARTPCPCSSTQRQSPPLCRRR